MSSSGAIIMAVFAAIWWLAGAGSTGYGSRLVYGIGIVVTAAVIFAALRSRNRVEPLPREEHARRGKLVGIASGIEGLAILVAVNTLKSIGRIDYVAPVIAIIVGLHFLPLAQRLPARLYYGTGAVLMVLGACGFVISHPARRLLIVGVGSACILWLTSVLVLARGRGGHDRERGVSVP